MKLGLVGTTLRIGISLGAIALIWYSLRGKFNEAFHILRTDVRWEWFLVAVGCYFLAIVLLTVRLLYIFRVQQIHMNFVKTFYLTFIGLFFNLFLPSAVGGDIAKGYFVYKYSGKKLEAMTSMIQDRLIGFVGMMAMAFVALILLGKELSDPRVSKIIYTFLVLMLLCVIFFGSRRAAGVFKWMTAFIPSEKWQQRLSDLYHAIQYRNHKKVLMICLLFSLLGQIGVIMAHYFAAVSLQVDITLWVFFLLVPIIAIVSMAPSLGGLGVREAGIIFFFQRFMATERALALSLLLVILIYGFSLAGGVVYALGGGLKEKVLEKMEAMEP